MREDETIMGNILELEQLLPPSDNLSNDIGNNSIRFRRAGAIVAQTLSLKNATKAAIKQGEGKLDEVARAALTQSPSGRVTDAAVKAFVQAHPEYHALCELARRAEELHEHATSLRDGFAEKAFDLRELVKIHMHGAETAGTYTPDGAEIGTKWSNVKDFRKEIFAIGKSPKVPETPADDNGGFDDIVEEPSMPPPTILRKKRRPRLE